MKTDVVIIGGGAMGAATAYYLTTLSPGLRVTVIERDPTYELASTPRASGGVRRLFSLPENIELSNYSIPFFESFPKTMAIEAVPAEIGFRKAGYIFIVPPSDIDVLRENYDTEISLGCRVIWLEPDEIKQRYPSMYVDDIGAAVLSPDDGWLDPHSLLMGFRKKAQSLGAEFMAEEVTGMTRNKTRVTSLKCRSGLELTAEHYINAAGAWAGQICQMLGFEVPITPLRRYEHYFECEETIDPLPYLKDPDRLAFRPEGKPVADILDTAESKMFAIADQTSRSTTGLTRVSEIMELTKEKLEELGQSGSALTGISTGYKDLDVKTSGLQRSDLIIIAGRS